MRVSFFINHISLNTPSHANFTGFYSQTVMLALDLHMLAFYTPIEQLVIF